VAGGLGYRASVPREKPPEWSDPDGLGSNETSMPRILLLLPDPPLPFGNAAARWFYVLLKGLVARGHSVTAFAASADPADAARVRDLFPAPDYDVRLYPYAPRRGLLSKLETFRKPLAYLYGPELRRDLDAELARGADVLHIEQQWGGWLGLDHVDKALVHIHYLFEIDLAEESSRAGFAAARRAAWFRAERRLLRRYPWISTLTPRLTDRVRELAPRSEVRTVPLGLDLSLYPFEPAPAPRPPVLGLIGSFNWRPTHSAGVRLLTRLWPEIKRRVPEARLQVVGRKARSALSEYLGTPDATFLEDVPDTLPYFRDTDVLLYAPSRGSGMKVKVMEAFALGVPVVTTAEGIEGLPAIDGEHAGVCEDDAGLIDRAVALLLDPGLRDRRRLAARSLLEVHCSPDPVLDHLERVYASILEKNAASRGVLPVSAPV